MKSLLNPLKVVECAIPAIEVSDITAESFVILKPHEENKEMSGYRPGIVSYIGNYSQPWIIVWKDGAITVGYATFKELFETYNHDYDFISI